MSRLAWAAEASVEALAEAAPDALVVVDTRGCILLANTLAVQLFGYERDELIGQAVAMLVPERYRASQAAHLAAYLAAPQPRAMDRRLDIVGRRKDATEFPADITLRPLPTRQGLVVVAAIRDITELKQLEAERAAILAREEAARLDVQAAARVRQAFMAAATHDLRNPLMAIRVQAELLEELAFELAPPEAAEQVRSGAQRIMATSSRMAAILRELLDVARLQTGRRLVLERTRTDLVALARRAVADHQQATQQHVLRLRVEGEDHALVGFWDAGRLERVLDNLLDNAIKYSPRRGEIAVSVMSQDTLVVVAVTDHGLGIPASDLPHVFEWFRRGSNVADRAPGSGLGLAGARQIVEQHGGTLSVDSREGEGSTFTLRLPRAPD